MQRCNDGILAFLLGCACLWCLAAFMVLQKYNLNKGFFPLKGRLSTSISSTGVTDVIDTGYVVCLHVVPHSCHFPQILQILSCLPSSLKPIIELISSSIVFPLFLLKTTVWPPPSSFLVFLDSTFRWFSNEATFFDRVSSPSSPALSRPLSWNSSARARN